MKVLFASVALIWASVLPAQYSGFSLGRTSSTVDWQYPKPPANCDGCIADAFPNQRRQGYAWAFVQHWSKKRFLGMETEARWIQKGYDRTEPTLHVNYIETPWLARVGPQSSPQHPFGLFVEGGPSVAIRTSCTVIVNGSDNDCGKNSTVLQQDWSIHRLDYGVQYGFGATAVIGTYMVGGGLRFIDGMRDIGGAAGVPTKNRSVLIYFDWLERQK